jgi:diguanylate cyclase (GGDEF)-like protein/PAS domain S-box-containing protein
MVQLDSLRISELQRLFGALPDAVLITEQSGRLEFLNPAAEHLTRHSQKDAEGKLLAEILPLGNDANATPLDSPAATCLQDHSSTGPFVARLLIREGGRMVEVSAAPLLSSDDTLEGTITVVRDVTRARLETQRLAHRATHDALTGLVNRAEFERRLRRAFAAGTEQQTEHVVGFLDLDGFKRVNDTCGHLAGDELLRQLAALITSRMRARDTVARLGGDEFGILLEYCTPAEGARVAYDIRRAVSAHTFVCDGTTHRVTVSVGLVSLLGQSSSSEALHRADSACYQAKHAGGNRIQVYPSNESHGLEKRPGKQLCRMGTNRITKGRFK